MGYAQIGNEFFGDRPTVLRPTMPSGSCKAMDDAIAEIWRAASRSTAHLVKERARYYRRFPGRLEILHPGLSFETPRGMIAIGQIMVEAAKDRSRSCRLVQMAQVSLTNAKAVVLLGRWERRVERAGRALEAAE